MMRNLLFICFGCFIFVGMGPMACVSLSKTTPLSSQHSKAGPVFNTIQITSGKFERPHRVVGVFQIRQEGYKWLHEKEVVSDADPNSILYKIGAKAMALGAEGVQHLVLVDENPQSLEEKRAKQVGTAMRVLKAIAERRPPTAMAEVTQTQYHAKGELVEFLD